jgi:hypothetical protein
MILIRNNNIKINMASKFLKRRLWTYSKGTARGRVLTQERCGLFIKHRQMEVVLQKYGLDNESVLNWSVEKMSTIPDMESLVGKTIDCEYSVDLIGNPWYGDILCPIYITSIKIVEEN